MDRRHPFASSPGPPRRPADGDRRPGCRKAEYRQNITITIQNKQQQAKHVESLFAGTVGELVIYPGSSGPHDNPFMEISAWSHFIDSKEGELQKTGKDFFKGVQPGMEMSF